MWRETWDSGIVVELLINLHQENGRNYVLYILCLISRIINVHKKEKVTV